MNRVPREVVASVRADFRRERRFLLARVRLLAPEARAFAVRLHGSYAPGGAPTEASDVDLLVLVRNADVDTHEVADRLRDKLVGVLGVYDVCVLWQG